MFDLSSSESDSDKDKNKNDKGGKKSAQDQGLVSENQVKSEQVKPEGQVIQSQGDNVNQVKSGNQSQSMVDMVNPTLSPNQIEPYDGHGSLAEWLERFEIWAELNKITDQKVMSMWLCSNGGPVLYGKLKKASSPLDPKNIDFKVNKENLLLSSKPKNMELMERAKFGLREQHEGESVHDFVIALKGLTEHCNFSNEELDKALRDRFILGLRDDNLRTEILKSNVLKFADVVAQAQAYEVSESGRHLKREAEIHRVGSRYSGNSYKKGQTNHKSSNGNKSSGENKSFKEKPCGRCLRKWHKGGNNNCPARKWTCKKCGKLGHIAAKCRNSTASESHKVKAIQDASNGLNDLRLCKFSFKNFNILSVTETKPPEIIELNINGVILQSEVYTGACLGVISSHDYFKNFSSLPLQTVKDKRFTVANGKECKVLGRINITLNGKYSTQAVVIQSAKPFLPLVGRTWLDLISPDWRKLFSGSTSNSKLICQVESDVERRISEIKRDFSCVFEPSSEPIREFKVKFVLREGSSPKFLKAIPVPFAIRERVSLAFEDMERKGIIERVKHSDWASQVVIVPKKNGDIRICCNYKPTLNPALHDEVYPITLD